MKYLLICIAILVAFAAPGQSAPPASIAILDDFSGPELPEQHGIERAAIGELREIVKAVAGTEATISYEAIGEASEDQKVIRLSLQPLDATPPTPVEGADSLDIAELTEASEKFFAQKKVYDQKRNGWVATTKAEISAFERAVLVEQMRTAALFDQNIERLGERYRRSDVAGAIVRAAKAFGRDAEIKVLILHTDCVDSPLGRPSRKTPFTTAEMPPDVTVIFVNRSREPDGSVLFQGLDGVRLHAADLEAVARLMREAASKDWTPFQSPDFPTTRTLKP